MSSLRVGTTYEVSHQLASALLLLGYARVEMRRAERRSAARMTTDRRINLETAFR
ncbi:MAG TPA: hypothetical protein VH702_07210 [Vicinamibacterales bacterium]